MNQASARRDGRRDDELRLPSIQLGFHRTSEGSVLYRVGGTAVLCTASLDPKVPPWLEGKGRGWVTAEYQMHPRANPRRESREGRGSKGIGGRTHEIQRLVGRALRAAVDLERLGERQITVDCDVLEADGGTRTASVTGGFLALALAISKLGARGDLTAPALRAPVAAVSVGLLGERVLLDLPYEEDSRARVDMNVVADEQGSLIEVQGTAEGEPMTRAHHDAMLDLALVGIGALIGHQRAALAAEKIDLDALLIGPRSAS
jgi:ribonuclease PH